MIVLARSLQDRRRSSLWWVLGMAGLVLFTVAFFPSLKGQTNVDDIVKDMPASMRAMFGIENGVSLGSAPGYLQARLFSSLLPALLLVLGIGAGAGLVGGAEEDGTLEFLLSNPIPRRAVAFERFLVLPALTVGLALAALIFLVVAAPAAGVLEDVSLAGVVAAFVGAGTLAFLHGSLAFGIGAATGKRGPAIAGASAVAVAGYLAHGLMSAVDLPTAVRALTPWYWYLHENMLATGANLESWLPALLLGLVPGVLGLVFFERRDLH